MFPHSPHSKNIAKEWIILRYEFNPEVELLLINQSDAKVQMVYQPNKWPMPKIGPRPPYYTEPIYEAEYPVI
jgi:hypothetical protein